METVVFEGIKIERRPHSEGGYEFRSLVDDPQGAAWVRCPAIAAGIECHLCEMADTEMCPLA